VNYCDTLQHAATDCNTLQHTATQLSGGAQICDILFTPQGRGSSGGRSAAVGGASGWGKGGIEKALGVSRQEKGPLVIYGVPYSEHSSFRELQNMVELIGARRVVPTVGGGNAQKAGQLLEMLQQKT